MKNELKRSNGVASIAGTVIFTVPVNSVITIIGCRACNKSDEDQTAHITVAGYYASGKETDIPMNAGLEILVGSKIVAMAGDVIKAYSQNNDAIDVIISYMQQTAD